MCTSMGENSQSDSSETTLPLRDTFWSIFFVSALTATGVSVPVSQNKPHTRSQGPGLGSQKQALTLKVKLRIGRHSDVGVAGLTLGGVRARGDAPLRRAGVAAARLLVGAPVEQGLDEVCLGHVGDVGLHADPDGDPQGLVGRVVVLDHSRRAERVCRPGDVGVAVPRPQVEAVAKVGRRSGKEGRVEGRWGKVAPEGGHGAGIVYGVWFCSAALGKLNRGVNECEVKECVEIRSLESGKAEKEEDAKKQPCG